MLVILREYENHFTASTGLLSSVHYDQGYVTSCLPGERLSNASARPTIGGNHHFPSDFRYIYLITCSFS